MQYKLCTLALHRQKPVAKQREEFFVEQEDFFISKTFSTIELSQQLSEI